MTIMWYISIYNIFHKVNLKMTGYSITFIDQQESGIKNMHTFNIDDNRHQGFFPHCVSSVVTKPAEHILSKFTFLVSFRLLLT